jgi:hypothetical protein
MSVLANGTHRGGIIAGPGDAPGPSSGGGDAAPTSLCGLLTPDDVVATSSSPFAGTFCHFSFEEAWCTGEEVFTPLSQVGTWLQTAPGLL